MRTQHPACFPGPRAVRRVLNPLALALSVALLVPAAPALAARAPALSAAEPAAVGDAIQVVIGKSTLLRLPAPVERISVGNPMVADVTLISPQELYLLGKTYGSTNLILWTRGGGATIVDVAVSLDASLLQGRLKELLPGENDIKVSNAAESIVLSGMVSSAVRAAQAVEIAEAFLATFSRGLTMPSIAGDKAAAPGTQLTVTQSTQSGGAGLRPRVVNMLKVAEPQQVMLEVKVAEVQKTLLDKLGVEVSSSLTRGSFSASLLTGFLTNSAGAIAGSVVRGGFNYGVTLDAAKKDGLIRVLAEPNIVAISGQEASFLAGGKIFLPVASAPNALTGVVTVTLEEKEFGVGIKFTPTVLEGGRINLKVAPEVSELSQTGTPFTTVNNVTAVLPSMTTRRAQTTVQLND
ncbi:MAG: type II and III secretion system protein family protein, partial [Actinomycetota bacterium]